MSEIISLLMGPPSLKTDLYVPVLTEPALNVDFLTFFLTENGLHMRNKSTKATVNVNNLT